MQLYAYNPKRDASGAIDLVAQAEVLRDGAVLGDRRAGADGGGRAPGAGAPRLPDRLQPFEPGDYELRVTVTDRNASAMATRTVPFTVE